MIGNAPAFVEALVGHMSVSDNWQIALVPPPEERYGKLQLMRMQNIGRLIPAEGYQIRQQWRPTSSGDFMPSFLESTARITEDRNPANVVHPSWMGLGRTCNKGGKSLKSQRLIPGHKRGRKPANVWNGPMWYICTDRLLWGRRLRFGLIGL